MVQINFALREVNCKIVYYGPGLSGKTTNLEIVHKKAPEANKGELTSIATEGDRTLFFDFMPLDLGTIAGMRTRFQLYTVPGQVYYNSTRKLVLQGVDGIVFVADSSESKMEENLESLENLKNNLAEYGKDIRELPVVLQYNKRDLPDALPVEVLNAKTSLDSLNARAAAFADAHGLAHGAGSDAHVPGAIGAAFVEVPDFDGPAAFLDALRRGHVVGHHWDEPRPWTPRIVPSVRASG